MKNFLKQYRGPIVVFSLLALLIASVAYYFYFSGPVVFKRRMAAGDQYLAAHRFEEAAKEYKEAIALDMTNPLPYEKLYKTFLRQKDAEQADSLFIAARSNLQGESIGEFWNEVDALNQQNPYFVYQSYETIVSQALEEYKESRMEATENLHRNMSGLWLADLISPQADELPDLVMAVPSKNASDPGQIKVFHYNHSEPLLVGSVIPFSENGLHEIWISRYEEKVCLVSGSLEEGFTVYGLNTEKLTLDELVHCMGTEELKEEEKEEQKEEQASEPQENEETDSAGGSENPEGNRDGSQAGDSEKTEEEKKVAEDQQKIEEEKALCQKVLDTLEAETIFKAAVNTSEGSLACMDATLQTLNTLYSVTGQDLLETYGIREADQVVYTPEEISADLEEQNYRKLPQKEKETYITWDLDPGSLAVMVYSSPAAVNSSLNRLLEQEESLKGQKLNLDKEASGYQVNTEQGRTIYVPDGNGLLVIWESAEQIPHSRAESLLERWGLNPKAIQVLTAQQDEADTAADEKSEQPAKDNS